MGSRVPAAVVLAAAWTAGVGAGLAWAPPLPALGLFLAAAACLVVIARLNRWPLLLPLAAVVLLLGAGRGASRAVPPDSLGPWVGAGVVRLEGIVAGDTEPAGAALRFRFQVKRLRDGAGWRDVEGDVLATAMPSAELVRSREQPYLRYGDALALEGALDWQPSFEGFDYRERLARQGIQALMARPSVALLGEGQGWPHYALAYSVRRALAGGLARSLPEPQAALAQAILLGVRTTIPEDVEEAFLDTGTTHLLAISGMNMAMVLGAALPFSVFLLGRRRRLYLAIPLALLWAYAFVSGLSPSVVRAALMASVYLGALALGRPYAALPAMGVAAALMTAQRPAILYDLSFQLSFTSLAGILLLWRPIADGLEGAVGKPLRAGRWPGWLRAWAIEGTAMSIAAVAATAPLLAFAFGRVSLLSAPATLLALPALPAIMAAAFATAAASLAFPVLGQATAWAAWIPVSYLLWVVEGMAKLPFGMVHLGGFTELLAWASYGALAVALFLVDGGGKRIRGWLATRDAAPLAPAAARRLPLPETVGVLSVAVAVYIAWSAAATLPDGRLHVTVLDVGQGDAILIQTPEGHQALVDGGPSPQRLAEKLGKRLPFWDRSLELVALSHYHEDHVAGLVEALRRYDVAAVLDNPLGQETSLAAQWQAAAQAEGAMLLEGRAGQEVRLGGGVTLEVLWPPARLLGSGEGAINDNSTVLRLRYGDFSMLLPGDLAQEGEVALVEGGARVRSSVLKVGHHGSAASSGRPLLFAVRPLVAVVSVGEGNPYGHPSAEAMGRIGALVGEGRLLTTAERGDIELATDGRRLWVRTER